MVICPSILEKIAENYINQIIRLSKYFNYFQIDIVNQDYVPNHTASLDDLINVFHQQSNNLTINNLSFDFHLMVKDYESEITKLEKIKNILTIKNIFIHYDLLPQYSILTTKYSFPIGLVLNPQDQISDLAKHYDLNSISCLQIMSVIPGAQGSAFIPDTLKKIEQLRILGYRNKIYLDGAVNDKTLPIIKKQSYLPDVICPGSFLSQTNFDLTNNFKRLQFFIHETSTT